MELLRVIREEGDESVRKPIGVKPQGLGLAPPRLR